MTCVYIYYRIDPQQTEIAQSRIDTLLEDLADYCSRPPRRVIRCDDPETWMEIYEGIADMKAFTTALRAATQAHRCSDFTPEARHLECFVAPESE